MDTAIRTNPTVIITGFLGAGKTTFLNSVLAHHSDKKYAIIENEFGESSIDSDIIIRGEEDVIELNNGCLCCTINESLYEILNQLHTRRADFSELIIEATGLADPRGLAGPFLTNPSVKKQFPLKHVICIVDATNIEEQLENTEEAIHQITFSDILLVSKTDLIEDSKLDGLKHLLASLNPIAQIIVGHTMDVPEVEHLISSDLATSDTFVSQKENAFQEQELDGHNHKHTRGISSVALHFDEPFDLLQLRLRLQVYLMFQASGLYRMKGILWLKDSDQKYLLQSVGQRMSIDPLRAWQPDEKRESTIVMIGRGLKQKALHKMFTQGYEKQT